MEGEKTAEGDLIDVLKVIVAGHQVGLVSFESRPEGALESYMTRGLAFAPPK